MFYKKIHFLLLIQLGLTQIIGLFAKQMCTQAGIYPGDNLHDFIVCTKNGGPNGNQLTLTKHTCPDNTIFKSGKCLPLMIVPYSAFAIGDTASQNGAEQKDVHLKCKTSGLFCTSCKELSLCVGDENEDDGTMIYKSIKMKDCAEDEICVPGKGCSQPDLIENFCPYNQFECSDFGVYPDLFDCQVYYNCESSTSVEKKFKQTQYRCSEGSFNSETNSCYYPMNTTSCLTTPVPICKARFQMGPLPDNLNKYYICTPNYKDHTLSPSLYSCPAGLKFDIQSLTCA